MATLYDFYQQQGKPMPTWQERVPLAQQFGIQNYTGTDKQNAQLLAKLQAQGASQIPAQAPTSPVAPQTPQFPNLTPGSPEYLATKAKIDEMLGQVKTLQEQQKSAAAYEMGLGKTGTDIPTSVLSKTPTQAQQSGRITNLETSAFAQPTKTYNEIYKQAYEQSGLANVQTQISAKDAEISKAKEALINEEGKITENPWLTETGRVGRIRTLYEMAEPQISRLVNERAILQNQFTEGKTSAENVATKTQAEQEAGRKLKVDELTYLQKLKSDELKNIPAEPKTFGTAETGYYAWEYDKATGKFTQKQVIAPVAKETGLTPAQINTTVNSIASAFDNEPIVKEYNTITALYNTITGAGETPADDISRIYAFAKIMDPNSVVREGEYNTVQNYIMSGLEAKGIKIKRIVDNAGFLTDEARTFMEDTLKNRMKTSEIQYKNVSAEYQRQINDALSGKSRTITDYSKAFQAPSGSGGGGGTTIMTAPDGGKWNVPNDKISLFQQNGYK